MLRAVLIDDDPTNSQILSLKIKKITNEVEIVKIFTMPREALLEVPTLQPDVLFVDIDMPEMDGFTLVKSLGNQINAKVVFVTAFSQYTLNALRLSAFDYLTKPVEPEDLAQTLARLLAQSPQKNSAEQRLNQMELLLQQLNTPKQNSTIALPTQDSILFVAVSDIIQIEASSNYSIFYLQNKTAVMVSKTLKEYEEALQSEHFVRVNRSNMVNLKFVKAYIKRDGGFLQLENNTEISVSPNKREEILLKLQNLHR
jgi:two-component system, LytTR family, response regulator